MQPLQSMEEAGFKLVDLPEADGFYSSFPLRHNTFFVLSLLVGLSKIFPALCKVSQCVPHCGLLSPMCAPPSVPPSPPPPPCLATQEVKARGQDEGSIMVDRYFQESMDAFSIPRESAPGFRVPECDDGDGVAAASSARAGGGE